MFVIMSVWESIIYGLLSGLAEFLPVSARGHQSILMHLFGMDHRNPMCDLFVHIGIIAALFFSCRGLFVRLRRELYVASRRRRTRAYTHNGVYEIRMIKSASFLVLVGSILYFKTRAYESNPLLLTLFFAINGLIIIIPEYIRRGNKSAKHMTGFDGILFGLFSILSVFPGISRIASGMGILSVRGADVHHYQNWILLLSIPALLVFTIFDFIHIFTFGLGSVTLLAVVGWFIASITAFIGAYLGITFYRLLCEKRSFAGFAFYSWGAAMFTFVLYLIA